MTVDSGYTVTQLWLLAFGSGLAAGVAFASLPLVSPRTGNRLAFRARCIVALLPPSAAGGYSVLAATRRHDDPSTALQLYIVAMLTLVALRVVFAGWLRRQGNGGPRSAEQWESLTSKQMLAFLAALVTVAACLAVTLDWLSSLWT